MKREFPPELQTKFTNELLTEFAQNLDKALRQRLLAIRPKVPSQTIQALRYEIMEAKAGEISAQYRLIFQDSGRHSEMKQLNYNKQLPVDVIMDWVERNKAKFQTVSGYQERPRRLSENQQIKRIAWAIVRSRSRTIIRRGRKKKARTWLNPTFYGFFNKLVEEFITKQADYLQNALASGFNGAKTIQV